MPGGKQTEVNDRPVTQVNPFRPTRVASLRFKGEAQIKWAKAHEKAQALEDSVQKRQRDSRRWLGTGRSEGDEP